MGWRNGTSPLSPRGGHRGVLTVTKYILRYLSFFSAVAHHVVLFGGDISSYSYFASPSHHLYPQCNEDVFLKNTAKTRRFSPIRPLSGALILLLVFHPDLIRFFLDVTSIAILATKTCNLTRSLYIVLKTCFVRQCQNISSILLLGFCRVLPQNLPKGL